MNKYNNLSLDYRKLRQMMPTFIGLMPGTSQMKRCLAYIRPIYPPKALIKKSSPVFSSGRFFQCIVHILS